MAMECAGDRRFSFDTTAMVEESKRRYREDLLASMNDPVSPEESGTFTQE